MRLLTAANLSRLANRATKIGLTKRERLVLHFAVQGKTSQEIACALFISRRTAEAHRTNMMHKLNLNSQTELVRYGLRNGLIEA